MNSKVFCGVLLAASLAGSPLLAETADDESDSKRLEQLAKAGDATAQYNLGTMYRNRQEWNTAVSWFRLAAQQGQSMALYELGVMAARGQGVPQDAITAFVYLTASGDRGYAPAIKTRDRLVKAMNPEAIRRAQELAKSWKPGQDTPLEQIQKRP